MKKALVFDGYVDEPSCFGVPPYISPYVRYAFGLLRSQGFDPTYCTCDQWRQKDVPVQLWEEAPLILLIMGCTVPGRYRGGSPLLLSELTELLKLPREGLLFFGGPVFHGYSLQGGRAAKDIAYLQEDRSLFCKNPVASCVHYLKTGNWDPFLRTNSYEDIKQWALEGAPMVREHPFFPGVMAELELSRGCDRRRGHCSFCTEGNRNSYEERPPEDVIIEAKALYAQGVRAFRLGKCSNILAYGGTPGSSGNRPCPETLEILYRGIRQGCPDLQVLHTDNCNPGTIAAFPKESEETVAVLARHNTPGDCLSMGIEDVDPRVSSCNSLKVSFEEALFAVELVNRCGGWREHPRGLPKALPGLNFLLGLPGETKDSLEINAAFLRELLEKDLMVRRINIRKVIPFPGAPVEELLKKYPPKVKSQKLRQWKNWVREDVDNLMLQRFAPSGTLIPRVLLEERSGKCLFGRPLGSYPPLIGVMDEALQPGEWVDVAITDHGQRSLTGVPYPLALETCSRTNLTALPGIGKARASRIFEHRNTGFSLKELLDEPSLAENLAPYFRP